MASHFRSFDDFKKELVGNSALQQQFQVDPVKAVQQLNQTPLESDNWIYRIIVISLGSTLLLIMMGIVVMMMAGKITDDKGVPTIFTAISSAAVGALAGLLAPSPKRNG